MIKSFQKGHHRQSRARLVSCSFPSLDLLKFFIWLFLNIVSKHQVISLRDGFQLIDIFLGQFDHSPVCSFDVYFIFTSVVSLNLARS